MSCARHKPGGSPNLAAKIDEDVRVGGYLLKSGEAALKGQKLSYDAGRRGTPSAHGGLWLTRAAALTLESSVGIAVDVVFRQSRVRG